MAENHQGEEVAISSQFQAEGFRFVKLGRFGEALKRPIEFYWDSLTVEDARRRYKEDLATFHSSRRFRPPTKLLRGEPRRLTNYAHDDPALLQHLQRGGNYGIINGTGTKGRGLVTLDADNLPRLAELIDFSLMPPTLEAGRRGEDGEPIPDRRHFHYLSDLEGKHLLRDPKTGEDLGDIRGTGGYQVVGPGCLHPSGVRVEVLVDRPLAYIDGETLLKIQAPVLEVSKLETDRARLEELKPKRRPPTATDDPFKGVSILDVVNVSGFAESGGQLFGPHPVHGSNTGHNLVISPAKNSWWCGRHDTGGGPALWLAVEERIIDCSEARPGALTGEKFLKVLEAARERGVIPEDRSAKAGPSGEARDYIEIVTDELRKDPRKIHDPDVLRSLMALQKGDRLAFELLVRDVGIKGDLKKALLGELAKIGADEDEGEEDDEEIKAEAARIVSGGRSFEYIYNVWQLRHLGDGRAGKALIISTGAQSCTNTAGINVILNGPRGCGKSDVLQKACELLPPEYLLFGDMSPQAVYYHAEEMPDGAIIAFDDITWNDTYASVQKRCTTRFQNGADHRTVTDGKPKTFRTKPRLAFWCTSVDRQFDEQLQDRYFAANIEDSPEHKAVVIEFMKARDAGIDQEAEERETLICRAILLDLKGHLFEVVIPYADRITLLSGVGEREYKILSDMVKAFCVFRYAVREIDDRGRLIATEEDFEDAKALFDDAGGHGEEKYTEPEKKVLRAVINCGYVATLETLTEATGLSSGRIKDILNGRGRDEQRRYGLLAKCPALTVERVSETVYFDPEPGRPKSKTVTRNEYRLDRNFALSDVYNSRVYLKPATLDADVARRTVDAMADVHETDVLGEVDVVDVVVERDREYVGYVTAPPQPGGVVTSGEKNSLAPKSPETTSTTPKTPLDGDSEGVHHYVGDAAGCVADVSEADSELYDEGEPYITVAPSLEEAGRREAGYLEHVKTPDPQPPDGDDRGEGRLFGLTLAYYRDMAGYNSGLTVTQLSVELGWPKTKARMALDMLKADHGWTLAEGGGYVPPVAEAV